MKFRPDAIHGLRVFQKFESFMAYIEPIVERFPNYEKSAYCAEIKHTLLNVTRLMLYANRDQAKWYEVDTEIELVRILIRRSYKKKYLSIRAYQEAAARLEEIGKMIGGLQKYETDRKSK